MLSLLSPYHRNTEDGRWVNDWFIQTIEHKNYTLSITSWGITITILGGGWKSSWENSHQNTSNPIKGKFSQSLQVWRKRKRDMSRLFSGMILIKYSCCLESERRNGGEVWIVLQLNSWSNFCQTFFALKSYVNLITIIVVKLT